MDEEGPGKDGFSGYDSPRGGPAATLVTVEEIFLPVMETLEVVEIHVILTPVKFLGRIGDYRCIHVRTGATVRAGETE